MGLVAGRMLVREAGRPERLEAPPGHIFSQLDVFALDANTARVHIGGKDVRAGTGSETGWPVSNREAITFHGVSTAEIWIDAAVAGQGVSWGGIE